MSTDEQFTFHQCGTPSPCSCQCPDGPCTHVWDGPEKEIDNGLSVTCSRCGTLAISHDMRCF